LPENDKVAVDWYRRAADSGHMLGQYNLALKLDAGEGVAENNTEALRWFREAAAQGEPDAQYRIAVLYAAGEGTEVNLTEAHAWLTLAAEQDHKAAASMLKKITVKLEQSTTATLHAAKERLSTLRAELEK